MLGQLFQRKSGSTEVATASFATNLKEGDIHITPAAADRFKALMADIDDDELTAIRLFVMGGGCGGMTYGMTYAESATPYDAELATEGYRLLVDAVALNYLKGCTIDYAKQGLNESFVFQNVFQSVGGSGGCSGCAAAGRGSY